MAKAMIFNSPRGKRIVFDDFYFYEDRDFPERGNYYVEMCQKCHRKYRGILGDRFDDGGSACGTCSVLGCENEAHYYVDFNPDDKISFEEVKASA